MPAVADARARPRVLHVSQPVDGGVANVVAALAADQHRRGYDVHVACPPDSPLGGRFEGSAVAVHGWRATRVPGPTVPGEALRLARIIRDVDPDLLVLHSAKAGLAGRLVGRGRWRTVYAPHAWSFDAVDGLLSSVSTWWEVIAGRRTDVVVCVSEDERRRGRAAGVACPMEVVPNGVDVAARVPGPPGPARRHLGLTEAPTVVCVGRLARQKGQDLLLQAWPAVRARVPDARLLLVGDGPDRGALESVAPPGVVFVGSSEEVDHYFAAADVVVLPSRWEGSALVALEAMAAGRPVVASAVDGVREALGDTGIVVRPGDVGDLSVAIASLLSDPDAAVAAGLAARQRVTVMGDIRQTLKAWDELLLGGSTPAPGPVRSLAMVPVTGVVRAIVGGALPATDVAVVRGGGPGDAVRASVLSALGVPVWWQGRGRLRPLAPGAPVLGPSVPGAPATGGRLAEVARRPGAALPVSGDRVGSAADPVPPVSLVVTVLNEGPGLAALVNDLLGQLDTGDELIVVDGGSTDGSVRALVPAAALRVHELGGAGISAGRNHGIGRARHDVIVCTDAGCTPAPGFVDAFRRAFASPDPPALVSGMFVPRAATAMEWAQALACYPAPREVRRPSLAVRAYTRVFGTGYDPRFAVGRCVAFTKDAWSAARGFPEHLATGEDVSFGLAVAEHGRCVASTDAVVEWTQRDGLAATWRMYRGYGRASTGGGHRALLARDAVRGAAYLLAPVLLTHRRARRVVPPAAVAYLSLPILRAVRADAPVSAVALLPVALAVKDLGKLVGAAEGLLIRLRTR